MPDDIQKKIFSKNLLDLLESREKSQKEVANVIGVSPQTFNAWCRGVAIPRMGKVQLLADYFHIKKSDLIESKATAPSQDPLRDYYDRLIRYLDSSPAHRQLISDAAHVRAEDIDLARQFLTRLADPDSSAPDLPDLDTVNSTDSMILDTLDASPDTSRNFQALPSANHGQAADPQEAARVELTDETLALVRDTPEVLEAEAEYIKKMSVKPPRKGATASPSTDAAGRKSG